MTRDRNKLKLKDTDFPDAEVLNQNLTDLPGEKWADLPDLEMKDIDVRMENGTLTLRGERKFEAQKAEGGWHRVERSYGTFERAFTLPDTVNPEGVKADYKNGVLTVTLPKKEVATEKY